MLTGIALIAATAASSWTVVDPPRAELDWHCSSLAPQEWRARVSGDKLMFSPRAQDGRNGDLVWSVGKRGQLVGRNQGLRGGSVDWVTDGGRQRRTLLDINPVAFAQHRGDIYVVGVSNRTLRDGTIHRLRSEGGRWQVEQVLRLDEPPLAAYARNGSWYLVTVIGVTRLDMQTLAATQLHRNMQWWRLNPSSIVGHRGRWYIGARRGVLRLTPDSEGYREQWMVPSECKTFVGDCACSS